MTKTKTNKNAVLNEFEIILKFMGGEFFRKACAEEDIKIYKIFIKQAKLIDQKKHTHLLNEMLINGDKYTYYVFRMACNTKKVKLVKELIKLSKKLGVLKDMLQAKDYWGDYAGFRLACCAEEKQIMKILIKEATVYDQENNTNILPDMLIKSGKNG